jgi:hypothetical protein
MSDKVREEIELSLVETTSTGEIEIPVITWTNCLPTTRSFVTPLGPPKLSDTLRYRVRAFRYSEAPCGTPVSQGTPLTSTPVGTSDSTNKVGRWSWDFGDPASTEKAYIAVMLVDNNVGG